MYLTGLSGNGKTMMIEQVCAALKRELVRVNITKRTDESDLIGSYELIDGSTVRREGPVLTAMRRGAVLLLDECDLGTEVGIISFCVKNFDFERIADSLIELCLMNLYCVINL